MGTGNSTTTSKVFVVQEAVDKNITPAQRYGKVEILLPPGQVVFSSGPTVARLEKGLRNFNEHDDYLLLMGDPVAIGIACAIVSRYVSFIRFLKWDRQEKQYVVVEVQLD